MKVRIIHTCKFYYMWYDNKVDQCFEVNSKIHKTLSGKLWYVVTDMEEFGIYLADCEICSIQKIRGVRQVRKL